MTQQMQTLHIEGSHLRQIFFRPPPLASREGWMCKPQMPSETQLMGNEVPIWKIFVDLLTSVLIQGATIADLSVSITPVDNYQLPHGALPPSPVNQWLL